jgi:hypothetical protein
MLCSKHLCAEHCTPPHHKCPSSVSDYQRYLTEDKLQYVH